MIADRARIRGVAEPLPAGESVLWEGAPDRAALARHALHTRLIAMYFAVIILVGLIGALRDHLPWAQVLSALALQMALAGLVVAGAYAYAAITARSTVYAITDRRLVLKVGLVVPTTINIPLRLVESASSRTFTDGTGQIALGLRKGERLGFVHLWPHVRPWKLGRPEPMLRGLLDTEQVAAILRDAAAGAGPLADEAEQRRTAAARPAEPLLAAPPGRGRNAAIA